MTASESSTTGVQKNLPFGAMPDAGGTQPDGAKRRRSRRGGRRRKRQKGDGDSEAEDGAEAGSDGDSGADDDQGAHSSDDRGGDDDAPDGDDGAGEDGEERRGRADERGPNGERFGPPLPKGELPPRRRKRGRRKRGAARREAEAAGQGSDGGATREHANAGRGTAERPAGGQVAEPRDGGSSDTRGPRGRARGPWRGPDAPPRRDREPDPEALEPDVPDTGEGDEPEDELPGARDPRGQRPLPREAGGVFNVDKGGIAELRQEEYSWLPSKWDIYVPKRVAMQYKLRDGMLVHGRVSKGYKHKLQLDDVLTIDGKEPRVWKNKPAFATLTSVDPDFHYAIGDVTGEVAMRVIDLLAPIGRGQRALLVAPPRTGKTTLLRQFAAGIEQGYPDVQLLVVLVDERPEEATEWQRSITRGKVFASTADETAKHHIELAEAVWKRACRMVECGDDVVILLDSITRLARAYNTQAAGGGRTMSGGLDSRAMERPRKLFGSARNTVEAGSLTVIGTCLVDTGSRMDQMVFEEFKGTGNSEIVLSRKLADRRIFPALDVEKSGTRKEEKLVGTKRLKQIHTLRRVLSRMHFAEAMDLLVTRLGEAAKTQDFLERFTIDPEA